MMTRQIDPPQSFSTVTCQNHVFICRTSFHETILHARPHFRIVCCFNPQSDLLSHGCENLQIFLSYLLQVLFKGLQALDKTLPTPVRSSRQDRTTAFSHESNVRLPN